MAQLARRHDGKTLTRLDELAQREEVSANFLVQILNDLRRAGLVESRRGKTGGYLLARAPEKVSLREVVDAVDPSLLVVSVAAQGESGTAVQKAWQSVAQGIDKRLSATTMAQLAKTEGGAMFYI